MESVKKFKPLLKWISYGAYLLVATIILLEIVYRNYWFDFYKNELSSEEIKLDPALKNILVVGDSFTVHPDNFVNVLQDSLSEFNVIKAGVPGTTITHHRIYFNSLLKKYDPTLVIYQMYTGNDIFEFRHPRSGESLSLARNAYWWLSERILVLSYINKRLKFLSARNQDQPPFLDRENQSFSPDLYRARDKLLFSIEPNHINNVINMKEGRSTDVLSYFDRTMDMLSDSDRSFSTIFLVIPHCIQVNETYEKRMTALGADPIGMTELQGNAYPFIEELKNRTAGKDMIIYDALTDFRKYEEMDLYFTNDPHLSNPGQKYLGSKLYRFIKNQNIVEAID